MFAQIKHMAIVSSNVNHEGDFYRDLFGMKRSGLARAGGAVVVRDGYIGLNLNPRAPGRQAGFDHFGFEVQDVELVFSRLKVENRTDVYLDKDEQRARQISHFALRVVQPDEIGEFYRTVFDLTELEKPADDPNHYLSDGKVTLAIMPWQITDFLGSGIERPALDHIGFKVESMSAFKADLEKHAQTYSPPKDDRPEKNPEREVRRELFAKCCFGQFQMADPDGVLIDVSEN